MHNTYLKNLHLNHKENVLFGRYITLNNIKPLLHKLPSSFNLEVIGQSVLGKDIYSVTIGSGDKKVLMWSQMHGNESTTTKAVFDLLNTFNSNELVEVLKSCTIKIIPILSPDGAQAYTRINANKVDLNRDAQDLSQPESVVLKDCFDAFKPDFCFNLHGQRTLFSAGNTNNVATLSFLSPAENQERSVTKTRKVAMELISDMNIKLQEDLPNQIGRYDDGFNINCVGDSFQSLNAPTILFEAGHYKGDYDREQVRCFVYKAIVVALDSIASKDVTGEGFEGYFDIPENGKLFYDIIIRNANYNSESHDIGVNYKEVLVDNVLRFEPTVVAIEDLSSYFGHKEYDVSGGKVLTTSGKLVEVGYSGGAVVVNNVELSLNV